MNKHRRRKYFLSQSAQPQLLRGIAILVLISAVVAGGLFYLLANQQLSTEYYKAHSTLKYVLEKLLPWLLLVNLFAILVALFFAIFYTHRIAGPIYRIQEDLKKIAQGKLTTQVKTRKKDQLKELESEINKMTAGFKHDLQSMKEEWLKLDGDLMRLEELTKAKGLSDSELRQTWEKIKSSKEEIKEKLFHFKTE